MINNFIIQIQRIWATSSNGGLFADAQKLLGKLDARKQQEFGEAWTKIIRSDRFANEFVHQIWPQSDQRLICRYAET